MKCKECQMENIEGALFCEECGAKLGTMGELQDSAVEISGEATSLVFKTADGNKLDIPAKEDVVIGREDPISEVFPDLDLTDFGGAESGVSRKHAVIHRSGNVYTIEDMGSTNGTYVNKKRIQPHVPQTITPGDELRFGKLALSLQAA
ncbi:MAG TPA: FHA domain-containing protein [Nitrospirota bacterium]|nr:FHA domain-containing protein [Nitrospirota bacterium]